MTLRELLAQDGISVDELLDAELAKNTYPLAIVSESFSLRYGQVGERRITAQWRVVP